MSSDAKRWAANRLEAARDERSALGERHSAAEGTAGEFHAAAELRAADEQVEAREAWASFVERGEAERS